MIGQRMMVGATLKNWSRWSFTINAYLKGGRYITSIPFNLYDQPDIVLEVSWGDGTTSVIKKGSPAISRSDYLGYQHIYPEGGVYSIDVDILNSQNCYLVYNASGQNFSYSLISLDNPMPEFAGCARYYNNELEIHNKSLSRVFFDCTNLVSVDKDLFLYNKKCNSLNYTFNSCKSLTTLQAGLLDPLLELEDMESCFFGCSSLSSIPSGLFSQNVALTNVTNLFTNTGLTSVPSDIFENNDNITDMYQTLRSSSLGDFSIHISSRNVTNASWFVTKKDGTSRIVYVPSGSTTQNTFNAVASSLGLTIIGE